MGVKERYGEVGDRVIYVQGWGSKAFAALGRIADGIEDLFLENSSCDVRDYVCLRGRFARDG